MVKTIKILAPRQTVELKNPSEDVKDVVIDSIHIFNDLSIQYDCYYWQDGERVFDTFTPADLDEGLEARYVELTYNEPT